MHARPNDDPAPTIPSEPLAARELEILGAYAAGLSSPEIADRLGSESGAVRETFKSAMRKLGAHSRLQAVILAARRGLLNLPS
jgi:LuxR family transcriptional regulator, regulator of acetate metabolism